MYGKSLRGEAYVAKYRALATWFLEHQGLFDHTDADIEDLMGEIDVAIDTWMIKKDPRNQTEDSNG